MTELQLKICIDKAPSVLVYENSGRQSLSVLGWELSRCYENVRHIRLEHVLQYLTTMEADTVLLDVFNTLQIGGTIEIICEDFDTVVLQWQNAVWDENSIRSPDSDARQAFARLFGPQKLGNPTQTTYDSAYPDTFKSAYSSDRLHFLLERAGFTEVAVKVSAGILIGQGLKTMQRGERQIAKSLAGIRPDHINRYTFAKDQLVLLQPSAVLDLACGIGYGSALLADALKCRVVGVDIDTGAIQYARQHYASEGTEFIQADARLLELEAETFDAVVSFETIEHVAFDLELLQKFHQLLKVGGTLIVSTPNQDVMPFDAEKFQYHIRHYTVQEFVDLVRAAGFKVAARYQQKDPHGGVVEPGHEGAFTILVCHKA
ncbi:class I SAM-dependent methyltransferase [Rheinheimera hassiensis]|uniref:class I SAM-dependent methyltransferase n=1 Tax=Rheinheimera hassiensis TaxID=1193627 RepID=UPI001F0565C7|nr:class I SAM-dependent methyltransferase [Rheinheimera hassiensis]